jgi:DNA repair and recombination protein RAD52
MELHYIEGWYAIENANRIFGYDGWSTEIKNLTTNDPEEYDKNGTVMYRVYATCIVRLTALGTVHEDVGYGSGFAQTPGDCIESAVKEATTDAQKRCLRHWGNQFGLALYDKEKKGVKSREEQAAAQ